MTEEEAMELFIDRDEPVAKAMWAFRSECARLEQAYAQRKPPSVYQRVLMEYEAVKAIAAALGHELPTDPLHKHDGGWYFWDETWANRHGPYSTRSMAKRELARYCKEIS